MAQNEHKRPNLMRGPFRRPIRGLYNDQSFESALVWTCDLYITSAGAVDGLNQSVKTWILSRSKIPCRPDPSGVTEQLWGELAALASYVLFLPDTVTVNEQFRVYGLEDPDGVSMTGEEGARTYYEILSVKRYQGRGDQFHHIEALISKARKAE